MSCTVYKAMPFKVYKGGQRVCLLRSSEHASTPCTAHGKGRKYQTGPTSGFDLTQEPFLYFC